MGPRSEGWAEEIDNPAGKRLFVAPAKSVKRLRPRDKRRLSDPGGRFGTAVRALYEATGHGMEE